MAKSLHDLVTEAKTRIQEVDPEWVAENAEGWRILDVREQDEYAAGHIPGADLTPRGFLEVYADLEHPKRRADLADRSQKLVLYCGGGHRSCLAAAALQEMGFENVRSMAGGWTRWTEEGRPVTS